ncbi:hypothetical protein O9929_03315 [Vibrio lentus]|nr:hypothetical protein [Vibrio lentus]
MILSCSCKGIKTKTRPIVYDSFDAIKNVTQAAARMTSYHRQKKRCKRRKTRQRTTVTNVTSSGQTSPTSSKR